MSVPSFAAPVRQRMYVTSAAAVCVALAACSAPLRLTPAPSAAGTPGIAGGATATAAGIAVEARVGAWDGAPADLRATLTPVFVTIANRGAVPLRIRYNALGLFAKGGRRYLAVPPYDLASDAVAPIGSAPYPVNGFSVAPYLRPFYPARPVVELAWDADPLYYVDVHAREMTEHRLPSLDMLRRALPEGVLAPGGSVGGFVYFQRVEDGTARVELRHFLIDAGTGVQFGIVMIPFVASGTP